MQKKITSVSLLPEHLLCEWRGKPKVDAESPALSSLLMVQSPLLFICSILYLHLKVAAEL